MTIKTWSERCHSEGINYVDAVTAEIAELRKENYAFRLELGDKYTRDIGDEYTRGIEDAATMCDLAATQCAETLSNMVMMGPESLVVRGAQHQAKKLSEAIRKLGE